MPRKVEPIYCSQDQKYDLEQLATNINTNGRLAERARVILLSLQGFKNKEIAQRLKIRPNTVTDIRKRFTNNGIQGLVDRPRNRKPQKYDEQFKHKVFKLIESKPPAGYDNWDGNLIAEKLNAPSHAVWRVLRKEDIQLSRKRSWKISTEPQFSAKSVDIIGLFLNTSFNAIAISVNERNNNVNIDSADEYIKFNNGKIGQVFEESKEQNGMIKLIEALKIASEIERQETTKELKQPDFLLWVEELQKSQDHIEEIHLVLDRAINHEKKEAWILKNGHVFFHHADNSESWFAQIEILFNIFLSRKTRGIKFDCSKKLKKAIEYYHQHHQSAIPFVWRRQKEIRNCQALPN